MGIVRSLRGREGGRGRGRGRQSQREMARNRARQRERERACLKGLDEEAGSNNLKREGVGDN